jgi:protein-S-isoprenylcysteine O-methyltransferase Ste14
MKYLVLSVLWTVWCVIHSAMISIPVMSYLRSSWGPGFKYYRIFYNVVAVTTLIPVVMYTYSIHDYPVFLLDGYLRIIQILLIGSAMFLFIGGALHFDLLLLLGIRQIKDSKTQQILSRDHQLDMTGVLGMVRHPWYLGVLLIIWARDLGPSALLVNIILTIYLVVGTLLEERKLLLELGDTYQEYQKRVPMLVPFTKRIR